MEPIEWRFSKKRPSDKTRDPIAGEFFSSDAITNAGEALVREGIQNSLDARLDRTSRARVRVFVSGEAGAVEPATMETWTRGAWPHLEAPSNGLRPGAVVRTRRCKFLVFEDFETTGLTGDPQAFEVSDGEKNSFFYFFRAEGKTAKAGDDRGRWGVGKQVFPRSSRVQMFLAYTESDRGGLLMGGCILRHHRIDGCTFKPDGYLGLRRSIEGDDFTVPTKDPETIDQFRRDFGITRRPGERGLSIVVPWLDDEAEEDGQPGPFHRDSLATAVLGDYFLPILQGRLEVVLEKPATDPLEISASTLDESIRKLQAEIRDPKQAEALAKVSARIEIARAANESSGGPSIELGPCPREKAEWTDEMLPPDQLAKLREALEGDLIVSIKASLTVRRKSEPDATDSFRAFIRKTPGTTDRPCHIREDLMISRVKCSPLNGFTALIQIDAGPLATLLGDAEGPAHTEWQPKSRNFVDKYTYGGKTISFVANFATELLRRVYSAPHELDRDILSDLFRDERPGEIAGSGESSRARKKKGRAGVPLPELPPRRTTYRVDRISDGFKITSVPGEDLSGTTIRVAAAYETSKGNAFAKYSSDDFKVAERPIDLTWDDGCRCEIASDNEMMIQVLKPVFSFNASGFDTNRDLIVKTRSRARKPMSEGRGESEESED